MLHLGPFLIHPHPLLETLGYFLGFRLYVYLRRESGDVVVDIHRLLVLTASIVGGAVGSKVLAWLENPAATLAQLSTPLALLGGKSIVGGLLGGLIAVELAKRHQGVHTHTGDLFSLPLIVGMAIGRIGCFLTGLDDHTFGVATTMPWGIDFGDGVLRHPTQLYEIAFLGLLALAVVHAGRRMRTGSLVQGDQFKLFMVGYLAWRLAIDFLKPDLRWALGLSGIQLACVAGLIYYAPHIPRIAGWKGALRSWHTP